MHPTLRPAAASDHALIAAWLSDEAATRQWAGGEVRHPLRAYEWERLLEQADGHGRVLLVGDEPVAFVQCERAGPDSLQLSRLLVRPDRRRQGHGRALCIALIDEFTADAGLRAITIAVQRNDIAARNLFSRLGFQGLPAPPGESQLSLRRMLRRPIGP